MKKLRRIISLAFIPLSLAGLFSCARTSEALEEKYSLYYTYRGLVTGIECYCWKERWSWYSCLIYGTSRLKTVEEISYLQQNLPCSLSDMKQILLSYPDENRDTCDVDIVSNPPTEQELMHAHNDKNEETYIYLYKELGLTYKG